MGSFSPIHWIIVLVVLLLLFGPAGLKNMGKGLGEGIRSFKKGLDDEVPNDRKPEPKTLADKTKPAELKRS